MVHTVREILAKFHMKEVSLVTMYYNLWNMKKTLLVNYCSFKKKYVCIVHTVREILAKYNL